MSHREDFLFEIQTEELPPKALLTLGEALQREMEKQLQKANLAYQSVQFYATPRRLALLVKDLESEQAEQTLERKGPALSAAFDKDGKPTPACAGFARSCGIDPKDLKTIKTDSGEWVGFTETVPGKKAETLLPAMITQALNALPIPKRMRWGANSETFIRPVHSVLMLLGKKVVPGEIMGCTIGYTTSGHRFHHPEALKINVPQDYVKVMEEKAKVIVAFDMRKNKIRELLEASVKQHIKEEAHILFNEDLLNEVTGLVEWPVAFCGRFDEHFLNVPAPALISAMQDHQRYFPIADKSGKLLPYFVAVSNIDSSDMKKVIAGNERVLRARLSDANFFFETDQKKRLADRVETLKGIVFQAKLGTLFDKAERLAKLVNYLKAPKETQRAALLCKTDLTTEMVGEFPELQGVMGYYYALHDREDEAVAQAIVDHYKPRFSGDVLPEALSGCLLALADRIDTLVGIFGINQIPTGDKDPFGLRRAAIGVLRILIEKELDIDLKPLLEFSVSTFPKLENAEVVPQLLRFMQERLKAWYQEEGIGPDVFAAVSALNITHPHDMHRRIQATQVFKMLPDAESLAAANKRVSNILAQYSEKISAQAIQNELLEDEAEKVLAKSLNEQSQRIVPLYKKAEYEAVLRELAHLRAPVDQFFDHVLVMTEDKKQRENRLLMLSQLRSMFLQVADVSLLVVK